jgi:hypothetical protein
VEPNLFCTNLPWLPEKLCIATLKESDGTQIDATASFGRGLSVTQIIMTGREITKGVTSCLFTWDSNARLGFWL